MVSCLEQNTGVNVSDLLCGIMSRTEYFVNVSELLCGIMSRPEYCC